jgi:hypothetical protein
VRVAALTAVILVACGCATWSPRPVAAPATVLRVQLADTYGPVVIRVTRPDGSTWERSVTEKGEHLLPDWTPLAGPHRFDVTLANGSKASAEVNLTGLDRWVSVGIRAGVPIDAPDPNTSWLERMQQYGVVRELRLSHINEGTDARLEAAEPGSLEVHQPYRLINASKYVLVGASLGENFYGAVDRLEYGQWVRINSGPSCGTVLRGRPIQPGAFAVTQAIDETGKPLVRGDYRYRVDYLREPVAEQVPDAGYPIVIVNDVFEVTQEFSVR